MASLELLQLACNHKKIIPTLIPIVEDITHFSISTKQLNHDLAHYLNPDRGQYDAGKIVQQFEPLYDQDKAVILTSVDLFIPILTFVFGLAKLGGNVAIVSTHRLNSQYYGLPQDDHLLTERLTKEIIHELGHLLQLRHCKNYQCVMANSNTADDMDIKGQRFCLVCASHIIW